MTDPATFLVFFSSIYKLLKAGKVLADDSINLDDMKELNSVADVVKGLSGLREKTDKDLIQRHMSTVSSCILEAFIKAYIKHMPWLKKTTWRGEERLPTPLEKHLKTALKKENPDMQVSDVTVKDLHVLETWLHHPMISPLYLTLWRILSYSPETPVDPAHEDPVDYLIAVDEDGVAGKGKRTFERLFMLEYTQIALDSGELEDSKETMNTLRREMLQELLLHIMASWLDAPVHQNPFQVQDAQDERLYTLERAYVEPNVIFPPGEPTEQGTSTGIQTYLQERLVSGSITLVTADFGYGKSLSSRVLAARLARKRLESPDSSAVHPIPVYISCPLEINDDRPAFEELQRRSVHRLLDTVGISCAIDAPYLPVPDDQDKCHIILDGLDEVFLSMERTKALFDDLNERKRSSPLRSFSVFSRPAAIHHEIMDYIKEQRWPDLEEARIQPLDTERIKEWCQVWNDYKRTEDESTVDIEQLLQQDQELIKVPILLYMTASIWHELEDKSAISSIQLYRTFIRSIARGKHRDDTMQETHKVIYETGLKIANKNNLCEEANNTERAIEGMLLLLEKIAWLMMIRESRNQTFRSNKIDDILEDLGLQGDGVEVEKLKMGALLALQFYPGHSKTSQDIFFKHRSFTEYLVASYWSRILTSKRDYESEPDPTVLESLLEGFSWQEHSPNTWEFFRDHVASWSHAQRDYVTGWAYQYLTRDFQFNPRRQHTQRTMHDEATMHLREVLIQVLCLINKTNRISTETVRHLLAWRWLKNYTYPLDLPHINSSQNTIYLRGIYLRKFNLENSSFYNLKIIQGDLIGLNLNSSKINYARFNNCSLDIAEITHSTINSIRLERSSISGIKFHSSKIKKFQIVSLHGFEINLPQCQIEYLHISDCKTLHGFYMIKSTIENGKIFDSHLSKVNLINGHYTSIDIQSSRLNNVKWNNSCINKINIKSSSLIENEFISSGLENTSFENTTIQNTNFNLAKLENVTFKNSTLDNIDWTGAELRNVDFTGSTPYVLT